MDAHFWNDAMPFDGMTRWVQSYSGGWSPALHSFAMPGKVLAYASRAPDRLLGFW
jgi:hypothetical protein